MAERYSMLVVDDIAMNRDMLVRIFAEDYDVLTAENGAVALDLLEEREIDIVLLDLSMPVMDGFEVIRAMKLEPRLSEIPIVVTTGVLDETERRAFDLGADDFITKPYDPHIVKKRVDNLVHKYLLQTENLRQALSHAEQLARAKSDYLSEMSHELRSPLNAIISTCSLMEEAPDAAEMKKGMGRIRESARYLLGVINDVLDTATLENRKVSLAKTPFDFRELIESIAALYYAQCCEKGLQFNLNLTGVTDEYLFGDPTHVKQILINLVSNAIKFTPSGGTVEVRVSQASRLGSMLKLRFEVRDTGEGIAPERLAGVWQAFEQGDASVREKHGGSGLGLTIVRQLAETMGGSVSAQSELGQGSTFTVELPFTVAKELPAVKGDRLKFVRALIIDDDRDTQRYAGKVLGRLGIRCDIAESGEVALPMMERAFAAGSGYDICFVDWRMPVMGGMEITRAIRSRFDDDTVVVVVSAYDTAEIENEARTAGATAVVPKPMFQSTVFDLLMDITGAHCDDNPDIGDGYHLTGRRVLLAEDNNINAEVAGELLKMAGILVERAENGAAAVAKLTASPEGCFDAILMDVQMPLMDGHEAARQIRASAHPQAKTIPIIAVTANAFTSDVKASLAAGMNAHIAKPIDPKQLYDTLQRLIRPARV